MPQVSENVIVCRAVHYRGLGGPAGVAAHFTVRTPLEAKDLMEVLGINLPLPALRINRR